MPRSRALLVLAALACGPGAPPEAGHDTSSSSAVASAAEVTSTSQPTSSSAGSTGTDSPSAGSTGADTTSTTSSTSTGSSGAPVDPSASTSASSTGTDTGGGSPCDGLVTLVVDGPWLELVTPADKAALAGIECIDGTLGIQAGLGDAIGLESLRVITGSLVATEGEQPAPPTALFEGLDNLERVGDLIMLATPFTTLVGLESLHTVDGVVMIYGLALPDLHGLDGLHTAGSLRFGECAGEVYPSPIASVAGLENLTVVGGAITIASSALGELTLPALASVGRIELCEAASLTTVSMPSLVEAHDIRLAHWSKFPQLTSVEFPALQQLGGDLLLHETQLADLTGFPALEQLGGSLSLQDNPQLPTCTAEAFAADLKIGDTVTIAGNLPDQCGG